MPREGHAVSLAPARVEPASADDAASRRSLALKIAQLVLGIAILAWVVSFIGSSEVVQTLRTVSPVHVLAAIGAWFCVGMLIALRLQRLLRPFGHALRAGRTVALNLGSLLLSDVTPGRVGYFAILHYLEKDDVPPKTSFAVVAGVQVADFILKALIGAAFIPALLLVLPVNPGVRTVLVAGVVALILTTALATLLVWGGRTTLAKRVLEIIPFGIRVRSKFTGMSKDARLLRSHLPLIFGVSVAGLLLAGVQWWLVAQALGIELPFHIFVLLQPVVTALAFVPVSLAGLGIQESGLGLVLVLLGVSPAIAIAFALLVRLTTVLADAPGAYVLIREARAGG